MIFWVPLLIAVSVALTETLLRGFENLGPRLPLLSYALPVLAYLLPVATSALFLAGFYMLVPNARVRFLPALFAGLAAAAAWEAGKLGFVFYVTFCVATSPVYGSLGLIPVVFGWVYLSWLVVLGGVETAYLVQRSGRFGRTAGPTGTGGQALEQGAVALATVFEVVRRFRSGEKPGGAGAGELAAALRTEEASVSVALERLCADGWLVRGCPPGGPPGAAERFYLARAPEACKLADLVRCCRGGLAAGLGFRHPVLRLSPRGPPGDLHHPRHRERQPATPENPQDPRPLPQRRGRPQVALLGPAEYHPPLARRPPSLEEGHDPVRDPLP
jgi:hypothetical protein